jgi:hypothetical protein
MVILTLLSPTTLRGTIFNYAKETHVPKYTLHSSAAHFVCVFETFTSVITSCDAQINQTKRVLAAVTTRIKEGNLYFDMIIGSDCPTAF